MAKEQGGIKTKREMYSVWKERRNEWKVQLPMGRETYTTKKAAEELAKALR